MTLRHTVLITAAGKGTRMGSDIPKQFIELKGKPILMHAVDAFIRFDPDIRIILVLPEDHFGYWDALCTKYKFSIDYQLVAGGVSRFESVKKGLALAPDSGYIAIHDGVRPFILPETIRHIFAAAKLYGNAIPAIEPTESIRMQNGPQNHVLDRSKVRLIQTPQVFEVKKLKAAYDCPFNLTFTDDASVYECAGHLIHLVDGQKDNIKITTMDDLAHSGA